jgi:c-di-GMP-binding flagellar brake protein YcgR
MSTLQGRERRSAPRVRTLISLSLVTSDGREFPATGLDISISGLTLSSAVVVQVGDLVKVNLRDYLYPITLQARVVRVDDTKRPDRKRIAVVFYEMSPIEQATIRNLFQSEASKRARA